jgi:hypothetical protein
MMCMAKVEKVRGALCTEKKLLQMKSYTILNIFQETDPVPRVNAEYSL